LWNYAGAPFYSSTWCGNLFSFWLTTNGRNQPSDVKIKINAGRQYVAFLLTIYYNSITQVDIRGKSVAEIVALGVPEPVAQAFWDLDQGSACTDHDAAWYSTRGTELDHFNNHDDVFYTENAECSHPVWKKKDTLIKQMKK
jgi:hypothetical protein